MGSRLEDLELGAWMMFGHPGIAEVFAGEALDLGATGIIVPSVNSRELAEKAVAIELARDRECVAFYAGNAITFE